jgi:hypothetical protein
MRRFLRDGFDMFPRFGGRAGFQTAYTLAVSMPPSSVDTSGSHTAAPLELPQSMQQLNLSLVIPGGILQIEDVHEGANILSSSLFEVASSRESLARVCTEW